MSLSPGTKLDHYEILEPIGKGGMGDVYRARDGKLGRDVAIKVLPDEFAKDEQRLRRFQREAKVLASLNHPNIAAIYGLEQSDDTHYLVLELVPGETLAARIARGPIPVTEALQIAIKVAEAVEEAHERGIVHRDLKPANIMLTPDGKVKVLDFGLAKAFVEETPGADDSMSPTLTRDATRMGMILGTAAYMSPEQAKGKEVDKRTDIWAFGTVLFEMLSGRRAFAGEDVSETLAFVLTKELAWQLLPATTPAAVTQLLRRSVERDQKRRLRDIGEARVAIEDALAQPSDVVEMQQAAPGSPAHRILPWAVTTLSLVAVIGFWTTREPMQEINGMPHTAARFSIELPSEQRVALDMDEPLLEISRDGKTLAWIGGAVKPQRRIYMRAIDELEVRPIPGTEGVENALLVFSPDGREVAFKRNNSLWKIPIEGGVASEIFRESGAFIWTAEWAQSGSIILGLAYSGLFRVSDSGGPAEPLTTLDVESGDFNHGRGQMLPGERGLLFNVGTGNVWNSHIEVLALDTGERRVLIEDADVARYVPSGHIVFVRDGTVFGVAFDLERLEVVGPETPLIANVQMDIVAAIAGAFAISDNGTLVYVPEGQGFGERRLAWVDRDGGTQSLELPAGDYQWPRLSPDGTQIAMVRNQGRVHHVYLYDLDRDVLTRFTSEGTWNWAPVWSPDASRIAFQSNRAGQWNVFTQAVTGDSSTLPLHRSPNIQFPLSWTLDGNLLAFTEHANRAADGRGNFKVWLLPMDDETPEPFEVTPGELFAPDASFHPKGGWLAYASREDGQWEIYIQEIVLDQTGSGLKRKISPDGGIEPVWARDGRELFYRSVDGTELLSASIRTEPELEIGTVSVVLDGLRLPAPGWQSTRGAYDVSPDGKRFLIVQEDEFPETMELVVILNWDEELKRLVPRDN